MHPDWCHYKKRKFGPKDTPGMCVHRAGPERGHREKAAICRPRREASGDAKPLSRTSSVQTARAKCVVSAARAVECCYGSPSRITHQLEIL